MMKEQKNVTLCISLSLYGLEPQTIEFKYLTSTLERVDKMTYAYLNKEDFFNNKKSEILKRLRLEEKNYNIHIQPTDIELNGEIYVLKEEKQIHPLFQEITRKSQIIRLEDLIKKRMLEGNLISLYICDKKRQANDEYESIFVGCPEVLLIKLEMNSLKVKDIENIWDFLKTKKRIYSIMRLLLLKAPMFIIEEKFNTDIPLLEECYHVKSSDDQKLEKYRYPYKND